MAEYSQKWHNGTSRGRSTETSDGLAAIQAQLNNLGREIKKLNEKVFAAQVGCKQCKGPYYKKDCPIKEEGKTLEEAYYMQFGGPFQGGDIEQHLQEIRSTIDVAIRNQGASIKTLEIQIGQMSKVLQERGFGSLPSSTEMNLREQVKSISTTIEADSHSIRHKTLKYPKGIAKNVLVGIGKFVFPVDFIILDMPEDVKVPLILKRLFLSTAHAKVDVFKRKITLRVGDDKIIF
ncbi:DNA-directed DNA polymerase [Tanacetum coccineum]